MTAEAREMANKKMGRLWPGTSLPISGAGRGGSSDKLRYARGLGHYCRPLSGLRRDVHINRPHTDKSSWWMRYKNMAIFAV
jgi:hypothetical protein